MMVMAANIISLSPPVSNYCGNINIIQSSMEGSYTGGSSVLGAGTTFTAGSIPPGTMGLASTAGFAPDDGASEQSSQ